jgi:hypothetical protein
MKRIIIICEGPTELEFCKDVLYSHFLQRNKFIQTPLIRKSGGGIVKWDSLRKQIINHLLQEPNVIVTTLIDYYGIPADYGFPEWERAHAIVDKQQRMSVLEEAMKTNIEDVIRFRFFPLSSIA